MNGYALGKNEIMGLLVDSAHFQAQYRKKTKDSSLTTYWGESFNSADEMALRLLERREGIIVIGVTPRQNNIKLRGTVGMVQNDGTVFSGNDTLDIVLTDFADSTTVSRFGLAVCDMVEHRANNGNAPLKAIMMPNAAGYARQTRDEINKYIDTRYQSGRVRQFPRHS